MRVSYLDCVILKNYITPCKQVLSSQNRAAVSFKYNHSAQSNYITSDDLTFFDHVIIRKRIYSELIAGHQLFSSNKKKNPRYTC